jgi:cleavage and polyadenylation specificity factor subunit 3
MENDRHLMAAEIPHQKPDLLIVESTYGVQAHTSRPEREARFTGTVERVVTRGGRCLIPVFALGRAQVRIAARQTFCCFIYSFSDSTIR